MENKHTPKEKWITRVMHGKLYVVVTIGHNNYHAIATVHDSSVENAELIASAPSLQSEIDRLQKVSGEDDIKILTLEDHVRNLESEIDRLKIQASNYAYESDRAKRDRDKAESEVEKLRDEKKDLIGLLRDIHASVEEYGIIRSYIKEKLLTRIK